VVAVQETKTASEEEYPRSRTKAPSYEQLKHVLSETGRQLSVAPLAVAERVAGASG